jgi:hypothetical protein
MEWKNFTEEVAHDSAVGRTGPQCKTCKLLFSLPKEAAKQLAAALSRPENTATSIRRALRTRVDHSQIPSSYSLARHRRGDCRTGGGEV